ncbi:ester cyclase [Salinigranum halophilum]|uniref:ester cyclase n=1 Tax=Salinigranum halophilum TaxID=2565931 RepID=UPI0010A766DA|nr:ester cyclase [Salinigranum halophilum]
MMTTAQNKEIVRRYVEEVWNEKDLALVDELYGEDYVGHWYLPGGAEATRADLRAFIEAVHRGFPDFEMTVEFMLAEDDLVTVGFTTEGTHEGEFMGFEPTGGEETTVISGTMTHRFEDGVIVETWSNWDAFGLLQLIGALPTDLSTGVTA